MSHDYFDDVFISFLDKDSTPYTHVQWRDRLSLKYLKLCSEDERRSGRHEGQSLIT